MRTLAARLAPGLSLALASYALARLSPPATEPLAAWHVFASFLTGLAAVPLLVGAAVDTID